MLHKLLQEAKGFKQKVSALKKLAPHYPSILIIADEESTLWATCIITVTDKNNVTFKRHIVESIIPSISFDATKCLVLLNRRIKENVNQNMELGLYVPEIDEIVNT